MPTQTEVQMSRWNRDTGNYSIHVLHVVYYTSSPPPPPTHTHLIATAVRAWVCSLRWNSVAWMNLIIKLFEWFLLLDFLAIPIPFNILSLVCINVCVCSYTSYLISWSRSSTVVDIRILYVWEETAEHIFFLCRVRLQARLAEAQEKVVALLSARMQVHGSLTDWLLWVYRDVPHSWYYSRVETFTEFACSNSNFHDLLFFTWVTSTTYSYCQHTSIASLLLHKINDQMCDIHENWCPTEISR